MKQQLFALSLIATTGLVAQDNMNPPMRHSSHAACCNRCECNPCCCTNPRPCIDCECYVPAFGNLECDWGFYLDVEFLYWYARESNLPIAAIDKGIEFAPNVIGPETISILNFDAEWDPGVRAGLGWNMGDDGWDTYLNWTYIKNDSSLKKTVTGPQSIFALTTNEIGITSPFLALGTATYEYASFSSRWTNRFNQIDWELGRKYWLSRCFVMRSFAGLRGAWTRTHIKASGALNAEVIANGSAKLKDRIWGVGFVAGFEPTWYFSNCFALYGDFSAALIWGETQSKKDGSVFGIRPDEEPFNDFSVSFCSDFYTMSSIIDLGLGLRWEKTWCCDRYRTALDLGWEHHIWFSHSHRVVNTGELGSDARYIVSDLGFGGFVLRLKWDF